MARIVLDTTGEVEDFIREQAKKLGEQPGAYLKLLTRAVYLAHQGDLSLIGILVPIERLQHVFGGVAAAATPPASPPPTGGANSAAIDAALDEYA